MSSYNYTIEYLPGKKNVVGDILSRLISAESASDASTRPRDTSDSLITMNAEVQRATAIYFSASAQLQHYETKHASNDNRDESTHYDPRANDAERMSEGRHEMVHETALFYGVTYGTKIIAITPSDYTKCPDFAVIYDTCRTAKDDSTPHPKIRTASAKLTAEQFIKHIIYVHGIATEITSDQDVRFRFEESFWQNFFRYIGTALR